FARGCFVHGVHGVERQVQEYLLQLDPVAEHGCTAFDEVALHGDAAAARLRRKQRERFGKHGIPIKWNAVHGGLLEQCPPSSRHLGGTQRIASQIREYFLQCGGVCSAALEHQLCSLRVGHDGAKRLPHFVCDRCAQFTHGRKARRSVELGASSRRLV